MCVYSLPMCTPKWPENQGAPLPESQALQEPLRPHLRRSLRMLPVRPIQRQWFALALSVLTQPTPGVAAPALGLLLNRALPFE